MAYKSQENRKKKKSGAGRPPRPGNVVPRSFGIPADIDGALTVLASRSRPRMSRAEYVTMVLGSWKSIRREIAAGRDESATAVEA